MALFNLDAMQAEAAKPENASLVIAKKGLRDALRGAAEVVDAEFGAGTAQAHPELLGACVSTLDACRNTILQNRHWANLLAVVANALIDSKNSSGSDTADPLDDLDDEGAADSLDSDPMEYDLDTFIAGTDSGFLTTSEIAYGAYGAYGAPANQVTRDLQNRISAMMRRRGWRKGTRRAPYSGQIERGFAAPNERL